MKYNSSRSSRQAVFCQKGVLKNFTKLTRKHLCWSLFFHRVAGLRPVTWFRKRLKDGRFPENFAKFLKHIFSQNTSGGCLYLNLFEILFIFTKHRAKFYLGEATVRKSFLHSCFGIVENFVEMLKLTYNMDLLITNSITYNSVTIY